MRFYWHSDSRTVRMFLIDNAVNGVKLIVYRYKSDSMSREKNFDIVSGGDVVPSQSGESLHNNTVNFACKDVLNHILKCWMVKPLTAETIIEIVS